MQKRACKSTLVIIFSMATLLGSCRKEHPRPIIEEPVPEERVLFDCPQEGDVYKLIIDTVFINSKGSLYTTYGSDILYAFSAIPLGVCANTADLYGTAKYSPLSAIVKTDEGKTRQMIWDRNGYFKDMILPEDIKRISAFTPGKNAPFELSLLNFNRDVIQTSTIVFIYSDKYPVK